MMHKIYTEEPTHTAVPDLRSIHLLLSSKLMVTWLNPRMLQLWRLIELLGVIRVIHWLAM